MSFSPLFYHPLHTAIRTVPSRDVVLRKIDFPGQPAPSPEVTPFGRSTDFFFAFYQKDASRSSNGGGDTSSQGVTFDKIEIGLSAGAGESKMCSFFILLELVCIAAGINSGKHGVFLAPPTRDSGRWCEVYVNLLIATYLLCSLSTSPPQIAELIRRKVVK